MSRRVQSTRAATERWFVYVLRCADGSLYTGVARDVAARVAAHTAGRGARYTRSRGPFEVCATRRCLSKSAALRLELAIKRLPKATKEALVARKRGLAAFARRLPEAPPSGSVELTLGRAAAGRSHQIETRSSGRR